VIYKWPNRAEAERSTKALLATTARRPTNQQQTGAFAINATEGRDTGALLSSLAAIEHLARRELLKKHPAVFVALTGTYGTVAMTGIERLHE
jgi:regulatory protein YycI of two-component signal transduction system YycFG